MANHRSALKRIRQTTSHTKRNTDRISRIKTFIKRFIASIGSSDAEKAFSAEHSRKCSKMYITFLKVVENLQNNE